MKFKCFNFDKGCTDLMGYKDLLKHILQCPFELYECSNGCKEIIMGTLMLQHIDNDCIKTLKYCDKCEQNIERNEFDGHDCYEMMKKRFLQKRAEIISQEV